jgi:hypothetical protein
MSLFRSPHVQEVLAIRARLPGPPRPDWLPLFYLSQALRTDHHTL